MAEAADNSEKTTVSLHGDLLEAIISHVPLIDLLPVYHVSKDWRSAVCSSLSNPSRIKPWLISHVQSSRNPSMVAIRAYDPETRVWIEIPTPNLPLTSFPIQASHSNVLYMLTPSKLYFSVDPLSTRWYDVVGPKFWRSDPVVAIIGSSIVVAGGTCEFEDDPLSVEIYSSESQQWETCQSMPGNLHGSANTTWLSAAVSNEKLFLVEKYTGVFCCFDPKTRMWECLPDLRPNRSMLSSVIGFSENRLVLVGLSGDDENVESLRIWEMNCESFYCNEIGEMPSVMLEGLTDECLSPSSISISMAKNMIYIYNVSQPKRIVICELSASSCIWESVENSVLNDQNLMHRFVFTCSRIGISDLQKAFGLCKGR